MTGDKPETITRTELEEACERSATGLLIVFAAGMFTIDLVKRAALRRIDDAKKRETV